MAEATPRRLRRSTHKCSWQNGLERFDPLAKLFLIDCLFVCFINNRPQSQAGSLQVSDFLASEILPAARRNFTKF